MQTNKAKDVLNTSRGMRLAQSVAFLYVSKRSATSGSSHVTWAFGWYKYFNHNLGVLIENKLLLQVRKRQQQLARHYKESDDSRTTDRRLGESIKESNLFNGD